MFLYQDINDKMTSDGPFCGNCGCICNVVKVDNGIGPYEYWGQHQVDSDIDIESECCSAQVYSDAGLTMLLPWEEAEEPCFDEDMFDWE